MAQKAVKAGIKKIVLSVAEAYALEVRGDAFFDDFAAGLGNWSESGAGDWTTEGIHASRLPVWGPTTANKRRLSVPGLRARRGCPPGFGPNGSRSPFPG